MSGRRKVTPLITTMDLRSKRLKIGHESIAGFDSPTGPLVSNDNAEITTPNSYFPAGIVVPTPNRPRTLKTTNSNKLLKSPTKSLKRREMSPLLLPRIHMEDDEDIRFRYDERYEDHDDDASAHRNERSFGTVWFDSDGRRSVLKPRLSRLVTSRRTLEEDGSPEKNLMDVAVELEAPLEVDNYFPFVIRDDSDDDAENQDPNTSRGIMAGQTKTPPSKSTRKNPWSSPSLHFPRSPRWACDQMR